MLCGHEVLASFLTPLAGSLTAHHAQSTAPPTPAQVSRDKGANIARAMSNLSSAVVFGAIFFRMKRGQSSIQDRMGLLQVGVRVLGSM